MAEKQATVLFVDDDESILQAIERLMEDEEWHCRFANNAEQALKTLQAEKVDVVVSDILMPGTNGFTLLNRIQQKYPATVRIFLTAFSRQATVVKALAEGCAQQIIPKPWIDQEMKEIIRSAIRQSRRQRELNPRFQKLLNSIPLLPALPEQYLQAQECVAEDEIDIEQLAAIISQDVGLSTALLHWANSALFGQRFHVDTMKKAIVVLGTDIVESLILSESINRCIAVQIPAQSRFKLKEFQRHSFATAIISRLLIKAVFGRDIERQDRAFIAGLLHDIGKLAAASFISPKFSAAIDLAHKKQCDLSQAEQELIGVTHAELGALLAEWWSLPPFIVNAIKWHHSPRSTPIEQDVIEAVHVANLLSYQFDYGTNGEPCPRELSQKSSEKFYLSEDGIEIIKIETEKTLQSLCS